MESGDDHHEDQTEPVNEEYLEFIRITRQHQAEREKQKQLEAKKQSSSPPEEYYIDISQVNTVVEANLVDVPKKGDNKITDKEQSFIHRYGSREAYEEIRSMEMSIDEHFKRKCQQHSPHYWPVIPIHAKPYLNPRRN